ncbi:MAG: hypothetical protein QW728_06120 [Thermoplasmata archaeon]
MGKRENNRRGTHHSSWEISLAKGRQQILCDEIDKMLSMPSYKIISHKGSEYTSTYLAKRYYNHLKRLSSKFNIRLPRYIRFRFCRKCGEPLVAGKTVRIRIRSGKRIATCLQCGEVMRTCLFRFPKTIPEQKILQDKNRRREDV